MQAALHRHHVHALVAEPDRRPAAGRGRRRLAWRLGLIWRLGLAFDVLAANRLGERPTNVLIVFAIDFRVAGVIAKTSFN
jgi:hypothetical protein